MQVVFVCVHFVTYSGFCSLSGETDATSAVHLEKLMLSSVIRDYALISAHINLLNSTSRGYRVYGLPRAASLTPRRVVLSVVQESPWMISGA